MNFHKLLSTITLFTVALSAANASLKPSSSSLSLHRRQLRDIIVIAQHHRFLNVEQCMTDYEAFLNDNPTLHAATEAYEAEFESQSERECAVFDESNCSMNAGNFVSAGLYRNACIEADGGFFAMDLSMECTAKFEGQTDTSKETYLNLYECFPPSCNVPDVTNELQTEANTALDQLEQAILMLSEGEVTVDCNLSITVRNEAGVVILETSPSSSSSANNVAVWCVGAILAAASGWMAIML